MLTLIEYVGLLVGFTILCGLIFLATQHKEYCCNKRMKYLITTLTLRGSYDHYECQVCGDTRKIYEH